MKYSIEHVRNILIVSVFGLLCINIAVSSSALGQSPGEDDDMHAGCYLVYEVCGPLESCVYIDWCTEDDNNVCTEQVVEAATYYELSSC